jgi:NO-binding membrane sensor protein with MHYT domain/two-component sensor histidine kinase
MAAAGMSMQPHYVPGYVVLSFAVAILASYLALDLANSVTRARGKMRWMWLGGGAVALGFGIWSMHFVGMLAFEMPGMAMAYDVPLMLLSIGIAVFASALALFIVSRRVITTGSVVAGGIAMALAIAGMHYVGMFSMRMDARIVWNPFLVTLSIVIALIASYAALLIAIRIRERRHLGLQTGAAALMGVAIAGMHYTGMAAATFIHDPRASPIEASNLLASDGLTLAVLLSTALILGTSLATSILDRAFARRAKKAEVASRLYREANFAANELREERELRDRFVTALAHDLRTPLTAAQMSAQLAARKSKEPDVERHIAKVLENVERMDHMIQDLLDAHRVTAGQPLPIRCEEVDLRAFLATTLEGLATVYGDRFPIRVPEEIYGWWDTSYLRRAIENLCTNAIKYGSRGTPITIEAVRVLPEGIAISVHNQGEPLRPEERENLFGLFHRGQDERTARQKGWGLGLTLVKGTAEAHGGSVAVESAAGEGTRFTILLPIDSRPFSRSEAIQVARVPRAPLDH